MTDQSNVSDTHEPTPAPMVSSNEKTFAVTLPVSVESAFKTELRDLGLQSWDTYQRQQETDTQPVITFEFAQEQLNVKLQETIRLLAQKYNAQKPFAKQKQTLQDHFYCLFPADSVERSDFELGVIKLFQAATSKKLSSLKDIPGIKVVPAAPDIMEPQIIYQFTVPATGRSATSADTRFWKVKDLANAHGGQFFKEGKDSTPSAHSPPPLMAIPKASLAHRKPILESFQITIKGVDNITRFEEKVAELLPAGPQQVQLLPKTESMLSDVQRVCTVNYHGDSASYRFDFIAQVPQNENPVQIKKTLYEYHTMKIINAAKDNGGIYISLGNSAHSIA